MTDAASATLPIVPGNAQHIGARSEQQDSFGFSNFDDASHVGHAGVLAVVADGMGGLAMGKDASDSAVKTFLAAYATKEPDEKIESALERSLHAANKAVNQMAGAAGLEGEVGTTLVAAVIWEGILYRIAAGDSRIYLYREGHLRQITTDYNYGRVLDRMVANGDMKQAEAEAHPSRAALTSYLGKAELDEYDKPSVLPIPLLKGDKVLLASDGLFGFLTEDEFVINLSEEPQKAAEDMVKATIERQRAYQDNITVAILGYGAPETVALPDTKTLVMPLQKTSAAKPQVQSSKGKWVAVVGVLVVLAVAGFVGGQYFGGMTHEKPIVKTDGKANETVPDKVSDNTGYRDAGASGTR